MRKVYNEECCACELDDKTKTALCPYCMTQKIFKAKWKLLIYWHLQQGTKRFNELNRLIPSTQTTLSRQLKELEADGIIERKVYSQIPPKTEYSLSPLGMKFKQTMQNMQSFGIDFFQYNHKEK